MEENEKNPLVYSDEGLTTNAKIKVIGVGGGGSNAVSQMINDKKDLVEYIICNTDAQALANSECPNKYVLGKNVTRGLGAGGNPEMGKKSAEDSFSDLQILVKDADLVFIACGEGGGTGTGAAPVIARAAKENGALVIAIVTRPFNFEGKARRLNAMQGIAELKKYVDSLIVVSNDKLVFNCGDMSFKNAFKTADSILAKAVKTITDIILVHGIINLDFNDVKATLSEKGISLIGFGSGTGPNKTIDAANNAINSPLLEASIKGARKLLLNITMGDDCTLSEIQYAINYIAEQSNNEPDLIWGAQLDETYKDQVSFAIIATDFPDDLDFNSDYKTLERTPSIPVKPAESNPVSQVKKEMNQEKSSSPLPDYLKNFLSKQNKEEKVVEEEPVINNTMKNEETLDFKINKAVIEERVVKEDTSKDIPLADDDLLTVSSSVSTESTSNDIKVDDDDDTVIIPIDKD